MSTPNNGGVYAIIDQKSGDVTFGLQLHKHDAVAIRTFGDIVSQPNSYIGKHVADYDLYRLGVLDLNNELVPAKELVITGAQWAAAQTVQHIDRAQDGAQ